MSYLKNKMTPCQTGFVPQMGIQVNLSRALKQIKLRTNNKRNVFGLFIDFANAYNTVPHTLLFQKLREKKCLEEDEISYLEALYTNYRIKIGKKIIHYNKGVAQGSILSPALFSIFIEDLVEKLRDQPGLNIEDILLYADDILVLCTSIEQLRQCIKIIEHWSESNGMKLNKKKSGIVPFVNRRAHDITFMNYNRTITKDGDKIKIQGQWQIARQNLEGIPIVEKYKYLGTYLDTKLTENEQLKFISRKINWLCIKLYPYLNNASADGRRDMWWTMAAPLFYGLMALVWEEKSVTSLTKVYDLWRGSFKRFLLIPKTTNTELIDNMIGVHLTDIIVANSENSRLKWMIRKKEELQEDEKFIKVKKYNFLKGISNDWFQILKIQCKLYLVCLNS